jgi:hypothetical protein
MPCGRHALRAACPAGGMPCRQHALQTARPAGGAPRCLSKHQLRVKRQGFCSVVALSAGALSTVGRSCGFPGCAVSTGAGVSAVESFGGRGDVGRLVVCRAREAFLLRVFAGARFTRGGGARFGVTRAVLAAEELAGCDLVESALTWRDCAACLRAAPFFAARLPFAGAAAGWVFFPPRRCLPRTAGFAPELSTSRCAFFQTLRVEAACLRARRASRFASLRRLRARFSSSLAIRTRCLATSAWSRARSAGSAGVALPASDSSGGISLPVFFIRGPAK